MKGVKKMGIDSNMYCSISNIMRSDSKIIINIESIGFDLNVCTKVAGYTLRDDCLKIYGSKNNLEIEIDFDECNVEYNEIEDAFYFICNNGSTIILQPLL